MKVEVLIDGPYKGRVLEARRMRPTELVAAHGVAWYEITTPDGTKAYGPEQWVRVVEEKATA